MSSNFCNKCNRTVQDGNSHCCSFYENYEFFYHLRQLDEELDKNYDETTAIYAAMFDDKNGNTWETTQQTSTSLVHPDFSVENNELDGSWFRELTESGSRPFAQDSSFHAPDSMKILEAGADQTLDLKKAAGAVPGPSTIRNQTIGSGGKRLYVCDQCTYRCNYESLLKRHYRKHTGEKPHACGTCKKSFSQKHNLKTHERTHTGEKPFRCDICGKKFAQKCNLDSHLNTHTGEWPYPCEICGKGLSHRAHLEIHLRTHTGDRPFECQICGRRFNNPSNLRKHVANPCRGPYRCGHCRQTFSSNEDRNRHIMQEHL